MWIADNWKDYMILDTSKGEKLERWGDYLLIRPDPQIIWDTPKILKSGKNQMHTITEAQKAAENGNFFTFQSSGLFTIRI